MKSGGFGGGERGLKTPSVRCADTSPGGPGEERGLVRRGEGRGRGPIRHASRATFPAGRGRHVRAPSVRCADTSPVRTGEARRAGEEGGGGFADGFGVGGGFGALLGDAGEGGDGGEAGFELGQLGSGFVDLGEAGLEVLELGGVDELGELGEGEVVVVAQVERGDGGVEEVADEGVGKRRDLGLGIRDWGGGGRGERDPIRHAGACHLPRSAYGGSSKLGGGEGECGVEVVLGESVCCLHGGNCRRRRGRLKRRVGYRRVFAHRCGRCNEDSRTKWERGNGEVVV